jgi:hypothetical protein
LYERIKSDYKTDTLSGNYEILYTKYVKPFNHQSAVEYLLVGAYMVINGVYLKIHRKQFAAVEKNEVDFLVQNQRSKNRNVSTIGKVLTRNVIPEYYTYTQSTIVQAQRQSYGGWYFGQSSHTNITNKSQNDYDRDFPNG